MATCDIVYVRQLLEFLRHAPPGPTPLYIDNQGTVAVARDPLTNNALKHVRRRHFFVQECEEAGEVGVLPIESSRNPADIFTKVLPAPRFVELCRAMRGA